MKDILIIQTYFRSLNIVPISIESSEKISFRYKLNVVTEINTNKNGAGLYVNLANGKIDIRQSLFSSIVSTTNSFCFHTESKNTRVSFIICSNSEGWHSAYQTAQILRDLNLTHLKAGDCAGLVGSENSKFVIFDSLNGKSMHRSAGNKMSTFLIQNCTATGIFCPYGSISISDSIIFKSSGLLFMRENAYPGANFTLINCKFIGSSYNFADATTVGCLTTSSSDVVWITNTVTCGTSKVKVKLSGVWMASALLLLLFLCEHKTIL